MYFGISFQKVKNTSKNKIQKVQKKITTKLCFQNYTATVPELSFRNDLKIRQCIPEISLRKVKKTFENKILKGMEKVTIKPANMNEETKEHDDEN